MSHSKEGFASVFSLQTFPRKITNLNLKGFVGYQEQIIALLSIKIYRVIALNTSGLQSKKFIGPILIN